MITAGSPGSLYINSGVTIGKLTVSIADHAFKIYNSGTVSDLEIANTSLTSANPAYPGYVQLLGAGTYTGLATTPPILPSGKDPDNRATKTSL